MNLCLSHTEGKAVNIPLKDVCNVIITMAKSVTQLLNRNERDCSNNFSNGY